MNNEKALATLTKIEQAASCPDTNVRDATGLPVGKGVRQGDVYVMRIADGTEVGKQLKTNQIVRGESNGSRHIVEGAKPGNFLYERLQSTPVPDAVKAHMNNGGLEPLWGPVIVADELGLTLTHPTHADVELGKGRYQTWRQMDPRSRQAVED